MENSKDPFEKIPIPGNMISALYALLVEGRCPNQGTPESLYTWIVDDFDERYWMSLALSGSI
jgi:hypothetical protein